jgi:hypothetical protein
MRFISTEDFDLQPYDLPAKTLSGTNFQEWVEREEEKVLRGILGDLLYEAFIAALDELPEEWEASPIQYDIDAEVIFGNNVWKSLVAMNEAEPAEGASWELIDENNRWLLLKNGTRYTGADGVRTYKWKGMSDMLVPYMYAMWLNTPGVSTATGGKTTPKQENGEYVFPSSDICREFNNYSAIVGGPCDKKDTLYGYLYYSADLFLDAVVAEYSTIVRYLFERFEAPGEMNPWNL